MNPSERNKNNFPLGNRLGGGVTVSALLALDDKGQSVLTSCHRLRLLTKMCSDTRGVCRYAEC